MLQSISTVDAPLISTFAMSEDISADEAPEHSKSTCELWNASALNDDAPKISASHFVALPERESVDAPVASASIDVHWVSIVAVEAPKTSITNSSATTSMFI